MPNIVWTPAAYDSRTKSRSVTGTATSGTAAFDKGATDGINIIGLASCLVSVEATTAAATVNGGSLPAWWLNPVTTNWNRLPDLDLSLGAVAQTGYTFSSLSPGIGIPLVCAVGRLAWSATGITVSAGGIAITILSMNTALIGV